jgi:hypothetical protein
MTLSPPLIFTLSLIIMCVHTAHVDISVNGQAHRVVANSFEEAKKEALNVVQSHHLQGGDCSLLPSRERITQCQAHLIQQELTKELIIESIIHWKEHHTLEGMKWDAYSFFSGQSYSRGEEMLFRDVARMEGYLEAAISLLHHIIDSTHYEQGELAKLTLKELLPNSKKMEGAIIQTTPTRDTALCAVTVATESTPLLELLQSTILSRLNIELVVLGFNKKWRGHGMKIELLYSYLNSQLVRDTCGHILFLDAFDTLMLQSISLKKLMSHFSIFNKGIVFNGETSCSPDQHLSHHFIHDGGGDDGEGGGGGAMPYLNSGAFIGTYDTVVQMLQWVVEDLCTHFGIERIVDENDNNNNSKQMMISYNQVDDQRLYTRWYLNNKHRAHIDTHGIIFHTLHNFYIDDFVIMKKERRKETEEEEGSLHVLSKVAMSFPVIFHGNGNGCEVLVLLMEKLRYFDHSEMMFEEQLRGCAWPFNSF